jgi:aspartate/methionine/tyrosine aminotransferase
LLDLGFHKENAINSSSIKFDNILSKRLDDQEYTIPKPNFSLEGSFADKYIKQVMAVIMNKSLLDSKEIMQEAKEKAQQYLKIKGFNVGAYSDSKGIPFVRKNLANWYYERDGYKIDEDSIYLTNGGINAYDHVISLITESGDSVLLPNPCYPIYKRYNLANSVENLFYEFECMEEGKPTGINV